MESALDKLISVQQEGTINAYCDEFQFVFNMIKDSEVMPEDYAIILFISGLKPEIHDVFVKWHQYSLSTISDAISLARELDLNGLTDSLSPYDPDSSRYVEEVEIDESVQQESEEAINTEASEVDATQVAPSIGVSDFVFELLASIKVCNQVQTVSSRIRISEPYVYSSGVDCIMADNSFVSHAYNVFDEMSDDARTYILKNSGIDGGFGAKWCGIKLVFDPGTITDTNFLSRNMIHPIVVTEHFSEPFPSNQIEFCGPVHNLFVKTPEGFCNEIPIIDESEFRNKSAYGGNTKVKLGACHREMLEELVRVRGHDITVDEVGSLNQVLSVWRSFQIDGSNGYGNFNKNDLIHNDSNMDLRVGIAVNYIIHNYTQTHVVREVMFLKGKEGGRDDIAFMDVLKGKNCKMSMKQESKWNAAQSIKISEDRVAVQKLRLQFLASVDRNRWLYEDYTLKKAIYRLDPVSRPHINNDYLLEASVARYKGFLHMIRRNKERSVTCFCVPTYNIDFIWHTHQLHPASYCKDLTKTFGKILEHDNTDQNRGTGQKLDVGFSNTIKHWEELFGSGYWKAGAMYRGSTHSAITKLMGKEVNLNNKFQKLIYLPQSTVILVVLEFLTIKNLPETHQKKVHVLFSMAELDFSSIANQVGSSEAVVSFSVLEQKSSHIDGDISISSNEGNSGSHCQLCIDTIDGGVAVPLALSYPEAELLQFMTVSDESMITSTEDNSEPMQNVTAQTAAWFSLKPDVNSCDVNDERFPAMNKLKKRALRVFSEKLSGDEIGGLKELSKMIDTNNNGALNFEELKGGLRRVGFDLFGSYVASSGASLVASISSFGVKHDFTATYYPLLVSSMGILVCLINTLFATDFLEIKVVEEIQAALRKQVIISTFLMNLGITIVSFSGLPISSIIYNFGARKVVHNWQLFLCACVGLWTGLIIGFVIEFYNNNAYSLVQDVTDSCRTGAAMLTT